MRLILLFIISVVYTQLQAQSNKQSDEFFKDFISSQKVKVPLYLTEKLPKHNYKYIIDAFATNKLYRAYQEPNEADHPLLDSLILTEIEHTYVLQQFEKQSEKIWTKPIFENWYIITQDSINHFSEIDKDPWKFYQRFEGRLHSFSRPVFLRNNSICIFYWGYMCGSRCGEGQIAVYQIQNGKWKYQFSFFSWVS